MKKRGHLIFAQNSDTDYVKQAYALALSIKAHNKINEVCLVTNDSIPFEYIKAFDHVVKIPWGDMSSKSEWKIEYRWKLIYCSPFTETLIYDADMLLLSSNDHYWFYCENHDLLLTEKVYDYRANIIDNNFYRKAFTENNLPNVYFGLHYVKKSKRAFEFYKWLEIIVKNYQDFYKNFTPTSTQKFCSLDVSAALAFQFMDLEKTHNVLSFTHMKPRIQGWHNPSDNWQENTLIEFNDRLELFVGNYQQTGLFHYTEDTFLTDEMIFRLENSYGR